MFNIIILPVAKRDIKEAADWYNLKQPDLGKKFIKEVRLKVGLLKRDPFIYAVRYDYIRVSVLDIFPFMIHFGIVEPQNLIIIYAVLHTSRNPELWKTAVRPPGSDNS
jgi:plasmid stabilization system protein ParE